MRRMGRIEEEKMEKEEQERIVKDWDWKRRMRGKR